MAAEILLRPFVSEDLQDFILLIRDKAASPQAKWDTPFPADEEALKGVLAYFAGTDEFYAVVRGADRRLIGFLALNRVEEGVRNLGYCIRSDCQGKGYGTRAAQAGIQYARERLGVRRLIAGTAEENLPSVRILRRAGFTRVSQEMVRLNPDAHEFLSGSYQKQL